jgi:N utilization substance protein A
MNGELLRIIDSIHRDRNIEKEVVFSGIEAALLSALKKRLGSAEGISVTINRETGNLEVEGAKEAIQPEELGRIAAQAAKQVIIQKIREAERDVIYEDFEGRLGEIISGTVARFEGPNIIVNFSRVEGVLPKSEQIPSESYRPGDRIRAYVLDVRKSGQKVKIILSRTHPDMLRRLFQMEVPEIAEGIVNIKELAREAGFRSKIAVTSNDPRVDCVGACVGVRGSRIKGIVDELNGEKIDIVRWDESPGVLITNALKPAEIKEIVLDEQSKRAEVLVSEDQLSLAIGKRGQNVRLASKLSGWDIDVYSTEEVAAATENSLKELTDLPDVDEEMARRLINAGIYSADIIVEAGVEGLKETIDMDNAALSRLVAAASDKLKERAEEKESPSSSS